MQQKPLKQLIEDLRYFNNLNSTKNIFRRIAYELENSSADFVTEEELNQALSGKVNTEAGKGLSTNDFSNDLADKLENLPIPVTGSDTQVVGFNDSREQTAMNLEYKHIQSFVKGGVATFTGDDTTEMFTIAHGLGRIPTAHTCNRNSDGNDTPALFTSMADSTNIMITFNNAPMSGAEISINWIAF